MDVTTDTVGGSEIKHLPALIHPFLFATLHIKVGIKSKPEIAAFSNSHV